MKKLSLLICLFVVFASCSRSNDKVDINTNTDSMTSDQKPGDLPYTASYSSSWSDNVSNEDLTMVLTSYKDWSAGNMSALGKAMGDSVTYDNYAGKHMNLSNAELMKMWSTSRDSLKSVTIDMQAWQKMYSTDKKAGYVVTWYKEIDTYKDGRVDSAYYHDINEVKDGRITWYSQYKRPAKAQ